MIQEKRGTSILIRMTALLLAVLFVQMGIYLLVFQQGGVVGDTEKNAFSIFKERTANRKLYLENEMVQRWSNTREGESDVLAIVQQALEKSGASVAQLKEDPALCQQIVAQATPDLISMLRRNGVTDAFLVLDCPDGSRAYPGVYVRDYDPSSFTAGNADLLLERGLPEVARENAIAMDSYWSALFHMNDETASEFQFFFKPLQAVDRTGRSRLENQYYYYWSGRFSLSSMDREILTYSIPLIWEDGTILGVVGVGVTIEYLAEQLKYEELDESRTGAYFLGVSVDGGKTYTRVCASGPSYKAYFGQNETVSVTPTEYDSIVTMDRESGKGTLYGAVQPLKLYNTNTPFVEEQWALIGILDSGTLLTFSRHIQGLLLISLGLSLIIGLVLVILAARAMAKPISTLATDLRRSDPDKPIRLRRIHITEIDALTGAIENLSNAAVESAARTSKIISMTQIPIGVFEFDRGTGRVFCSQNLFRILGWPEAEAGDGYLEAEEFAARLKSVTSNVYEQEEHVYRVPQPDGGDHWLQFSHREEGQVVLGAVEDVTKDMEAKRKMEYERDFDILTDLFNRRAFDDRMGRLFQPEKRGTLGIAALLMLDLDNLKYVNDTFGHDYGDKYLQAFAKSLEYFYRCRSVVSRRSGDEFNVFLYGYATQDEIRALVEQFWAELKTKTIALPYGKEIKVRASGGLAWYPTDADNYDELLRLADFAMYNIKHTFKGAIQEFDRANYEQNAILIHGQDALNRLLDNRLVRYAFQPIVSARDGHTVGYEMLMRPLVEQFFNLGDLFRLAKAESKLYQIERLTWFEAIAAFAGQVKNGGMNQGELVFINSIGGQCLTNADMIDLEHRFGKLLGRVVIELTEGEEISQAAISQKQKKAADWHAKIALDDYGSGFNGESVLISVRPDIVKVDISIIRGIDKDLSKQRLLNNLISFSVERGIEVLAEGVETYAEMETVIRAGVHYLQGYYLARPDFDPPTIPAQVLEEIRRIQPIA